MNRVNAIKMNVTLSLFHLTNYEHVKHVPYYKISTPKSPIYTQEEERDRDSAVANKTKSAAANAAQISIKQTDIKSQIASSMQIKTS